MKRKLFIICAFFLVSNFCNAQIEKGDIIAGVDFYYYSKKQDISETFNGHTLNFLIKNKYFVVQPSAEYAVSNKLSLGVKVKYLVETEISELRSEEEKSKFKYLTINPFIHHYLNISERFLLISGFNLSYGFRSNPPNSTDDINIYNLERIYRVYLSSAVGYKITDKLLLHLNLIEAGYKVDKFIEEYRPQVQGYEDEIISKTSSNEFSINLDKTTITIGAKYRF